MRAALDLSVPRYCLCSRSLQPYLCSPRLPQSCVLKTCFDSRCRVVLPILVGNNCSPRCALRGPVCVLKAYTLQCSTVHTCSQSIQSVLDYSPGTSCVCIRSICFSNLRERILSVLEYYHNADTFLRGLPFRKVSEHRSRCELSVITPLYFVHTTYVSAVTTTARDQCC